MMWLVFKNNEMSCDFRMPCSADDAHCVAMEEIKMTTEQVDVFCHNFRTCGVESSCCDESPSPASVETVCFSPSKRTSYGSVTALTARVILEFLPAVPFVRMSGLNGHWRNLVLGSIKSHAHLRNRYFVARLTVATVVKDAAALSMLLRQLAEDSSIYESAAAGCGGGSGRASAAISPLGQAIASAKQANVTIALEAQVHLHTPRPRP
jgi:hypothetical protein